MGSFSLSQRRDSCKNPSSLDRGEYRSTSESPERPREYHEDRVHLESSHEHDEGKPELDPPGEEGIVRGGTDKRETGADIPEIGQGGGDACRYIVPGNAYEDERDHHYA